MSSETGVGASSPSSPGLSAVERSEARYVLAISEVSETGSDRVTTGTLRRYMDVAPASVTEMVAKLDDRGLVEYEKYDGVTLTDAGEVIAARAGWRFCVVSTFFDSTLDTTLDDRTAFDIGYALPREGVFSLRDLVGSACLDLCPEATGDERCVV